MHCKCLICVSKAYMQINAFLIIALSCKCVTCRESILYIGVQRKRVWGKESILELVIIYSKHFPLTCTNRRYPSDVLFLMFISLTMNFLGEIRKMIKNSKALQLLRIFVSPNEPIVIINLDAIDLRLRKT